MKPNPQKANPAFGSETQNAPGRMLPPFSSAPTGRLPHPSQGPPHAPNPPMMTAQPYYGYPPGLQPPPGNGYDGQISQRYPPYLPPYACPSEPPVGPFGGQIFAKSRSGSYDYEQPNGPYYPPPGSFDGPTANPRAGFERSATAGPQPHILRTNSSGSTGSAGSGTAGRSAYPPGPRPYPRNPPALVNKYGHHPGSGPAIKPPAPLRPSGPYTTAQLESMPRGPGKTLGKQLEAEKVQVGSHKELRKMLMQDDQPSMKSTEHLDPDERAYTAITGRSGATSPSQIDSFRREDVVTMGCTCKKSKCLKLYCMCFGASVVCGQNCRCLVCHNTPNHEQVRKDAIRNILARNPSAFDTKFRKTEEPAPVAAAKTGPNRAITHKLGCKCRKSFCTKKYCECYNAGVKCSGSCRCVGCKNVPVGGLGPRGDKSPGMIAAPKRSDFSRSLVVKKSSKQPPVVLQKSGEPWMVNSAAQNLAFLKHASPAKPEGKPVRSLSGTRDNSITSLPSLTASESSKSPSDQEAAGVNSLLMAAYAMTELFSQDPSPAATADGTPEKQEIEVTKFRSPKRKSKLSEDEAPPKETAPEDYVPEVATPGVARKLKRTRVGTVEKSRPVSALVTETSLLCEEELDAGPRVEEKSPSDSEESADDDESTPSVTAESEDADIPPKPFTTPQGKKDIINVMTPVTARCIDFQHMEVTDGEEVVIGEEKKENDTAMETEQY